MYALNIYPYFKHAMHFIYHYKNCRRYLIRHAMIWRYKIDSSYLVILIGYHVIVLENPLSISTSQPSCFKMHYIYKNDIFYIWFH